jgi:hypothetical protein
LVGPGLRVAGDGGGNTTATQQPDPEVANFHILGGSCCDITTTATFTGTILVTLPYDEASLPVPESSLRMLHKEGGEWVDVTRSVDTDANRVTGEVDSLSPFALGWKAANVWYLAEGCTEGGMETWVLVQNPNDDLVRVNLTFMTSRGKVDGPQGFEIAGKSRHPFNLNELDKDWNVSTKVESRGGDVICERAMYGNGRAWAHDSVGYEP